MIMSLNSVIDDKQLDVFMEELKGRDEMLCIGNVCGIAVNPCLGQGCGAACIGITVCLAGAHIS